MVTKSVYSVPLLGQLRPRRSSSSLLKRSNLESFFISQGSEPIDFSIFHPTIQKICIIPSVEIDVDVPQRVFEYTVISPLDSALILVEQMGALRPTELHIRNIGAFGCILDYTWLRFWWTRWNICSIHFLDKSGVSFHEVYNCSIQAAYHSQPLPVPMQRHDYAAVVNIHLQKFNLCTKATSCQD